MCQGRGAKALQGALAQDRGGFLPSCYKPPQSSPVPPSSPHRSPDSASLRAGPPAVLSPVPGLELRLSTWQTWRFGFCLICIEVTYTSEQILAAPRSFWGQRHLRQLRGQEGPDAWCPAPSHPVLGQGSELCF